MQTTSSAPLQSGNRYAARVLIWARSGDMRHLALMEITAAGWRNRPTGARNEDRRQEGK